MIYVQKMFTFICGMFSAIRKIYFLEVLPCILAKSIQIRFAQQRWYLRDEVSSSVKWSANTSSKKIKGVKLDCENIGLYRPLVNFINILRAHFFYESAFLPQSFCQSQNLKCWWNWHLDYHCHLKIQSSIWSKF